MNILLIVVGKLKRNTGLDGLKLLLILMVVFIHAGNNIQRIFLGNGDIYSDTVIFIMNFISFGITRAAVPIFFVLSGFFLADRFNTVEFTFWGEIKNRVKQILVPYIVWNCTVIMIFFLIQLIPQTHKFFNKKIIFDLHFLQFLDMLFINPIPYQLWFLRDLFILSLMSPIIIYSLKYFSWLFLPILGVIWLKNINCYISTEAVLFFSIGLYFCGRDSFLFQRSKYYSWLHILWFFCVICSVLLQLLGYSEYIYAYKVQIILGVLVLCRNSQAKFMLDLAKYKEYIFPIFLFHEPLMTFVNKITSKIIHDNYAVTQLILFFFIPFIVIFLSILLSLLVNRLTPRYYSYLIGRF